LIRLTEEVASARSAGRAIIALESSVLAQGLEPPHNTEAERLMSSAVRSAGAVPAITAVVGGTPTLGLTSEELDRFLTRRGIRKLSARDLAVAIAQRADGATTVAAALAICAAADVEVFATGGIGGVHRDQPYDESADLIELSRTPVVVVCAGAKSILDLSATLERLESLGVAVVGYRTDSLPGFYYRDTGLTLTVRAESSEEIAAMYRAHRALGATSALLVVQSPPAQHALEREEVEAALTEATAAAARAGVRGGALTPFLLSHLARATSGRSVIANLALLEANARLAGEIGFRLTSGE
jgi:pseudouridine-5'-phosphate glycosidase